MNTPQARFFLRCFLLLGAVVSLATESFSDPSSREHVWDITFPLDKNTGTYAWGWHLCRDGCSRAHRAVDIYATPGTPVYAAADGVVSWRRTSAASSWSPVSGTGYALHLDHPEGLYRHTYGHFGPDKPGRESEAFGINPATGEFWKVGDTVQRGQHLGYVGTSGATASGPHLHFELRSLRPAWPVDDPGDDAIAGRSYGDRSSSIGSFSYLRWDPFPSLQAAEARDDYPDGSAPPPSYRFKVGDYVRVVGVNNALNMRGPEPCDAPIPGGGRPLGMVGRIIGGPAECPDITSYHMWKIQWSDCQIGWSSQVYLDNAETPDEFCPDYEVSVTVKGQGEVTSAPAQSGYLPGAAITLKATPADAFDFSHWSGSYSSNDNPLALTVDEDLSLTAHFLRTYGAWTISQFTPEEQETAGLTAPDNDPFGSGVVNLASYAFGLDVRAPDRTGLPRMERDGDDMVFLFYRLSGDSDVAYSLEISADLSSWSELPLDEGTWSIVSTGDSGTELVRVSLPPDSLGSAQFVRLRLRRDGIGSAP